MDLLNSIWPPLQQKPGRKEGRKAGFLYAEGIFARRLNDPVTHSLSQEEPLFFSSAANNPLVSQSVRKPNL